MNSIHTSARALLAIGTGAALLLGAGCGKKGSTTPRQKGLELTEAGLLGITESTRTDSPTIQATVPDAELRPDPESSDVLEMWRGSDRLFYVVAKSGTDPAMGVFNVQVTSGAVAGPNGWRVGTNLASTAGLDQCECWQDLRVCFKKGTHVAVAIDKDDCEGLPGVGTAIVGRPIARLIWNPRPWPEIADYDSGSGEEDPCGGGDNPCGGWDDEDDSGDEGE